MEVLGANVRCHSDITGLRLPSLSSPLPVLSFYADDMSAVSCSDRATRVILSVYGRFERFGVDPQTVLATPSLFLLIESGLPVFLSCTFACLDCPSRFLVTGRPCCWFCRHLFTQGRLRNLQGLLLASPVLKPCTDSLTVW